MHAVSMPSSIDDNPNPEISVVSRKAQGAADTRQHGRQSHPLWAQPDDVARTTLEHLLRRRRSPAPARWRDRKTFFIRFLVPRARPCSPISMLSYDQVSTP